MKVSALSSGSSGNCFYVEKDNAAILVDVGINAKNVMERMDLLDLDARKLKAIFITHEHIDHIRGVDVLARRFNLPIFATRGTISNGFLCSNKEMIKPIKEFERIRVGELEVEAFSKFHKAAEPVSFSIFNNKKTVSVITDAGYACKNINDKIAQSDFLFIESNHDIKMLEQGSYPYFLKKWITGETGHLSNRQAGLAVLEHADKRLKNVVLSHISTTNNTPSMALKTFRGILKERSDLQAHLSVSLESEPTPLFSL